jgi:DNA processing protein
VPESSRAVGDLPRGWPPGFTDDDGARDAILRLASLRGLTPLRLRAAAWRYGSAAACVRAVEVGELGSEQDRAHMVDLDAGGMKRSLGSCGASAHFPGDSGYPEPLSHLQDPPLVLFVRGSALDPADIHVAVVGARACTPLGRELASTMSRQLARYAVVVSGAARGIDTAAHEGCLAGGGRTVAVLGCGIDVAYPKSNASLLNRILDRGGSVVSEYPPGVPAEPFRFPARNRIIAGLSRAVVLVQGGERSGSLITAEHALDLGRSVYAVPGAINDPLFAAPLAAIRDGAGLIRGCDDLLHDLEIDRDPATDRRAQLTLAEDAVLQRLSGPTLAESVARDLEVATGTAVAILLELELKGLVRSAGGRFEPTAAAARGVPTAG